MLPKIMAVLTAVSVMGLVGSAVNTSVAGSQTEDQFKRYKAVEAYEVRPGVLMMPRYDSGGQVCERADGGQMARAVCRSPSRRPAR
jgi:hypothetical protein